MIEKNNVSSLNQLSEENLFQTFNNAGKRRFLFVGNSITRHGPKPEIGWENDWGMPDISQIVPLSNVFGVTTDVLFGKNGTDGEEAIASFIRDVEKMIVALEKKELPLLVNINCREWNGKDSGVLR